jgi:cap2 methyltransferase
MNELICKSAMDSDPFIKKQSSMSLLKETICLTIGHDHPRKKYEPKGWEGRKTIRHWGQRKLLMTEILFLTRWGHLGKKVLYVGSAPGNHIPYLSYMFPEHDFILVDPSPFQIKETKKIKIINDYFNDAMAKSYANQNVLFLSDIRTADFRQMGQVENEEFILRDNGSQIDWINIMKPLKSMVKFRCTYANIIDSKTLMYKGTIFLQPWAPGNSTETRLVVDDSLELMKYDNLEYEEHLFYHNDVTRYEHYSQPVKGEGLDKSFDAAAEVIILCEFLEKYPQFLKDGYFKTISQMSSVISREITDTGRTLETLMVNPVKRRQFPEINHKKSETSVQSELNEV